MKVAGNNVNFCIAGKVNNGEFVMYYTENDKEWFPIRMFSLSKTDNLKIGFSVQSPVGDGSTATFSNIEYKNTFQESGYF